MFVCSQEVDTLSWLIWPSIFGRVWDSWTIVLPRHLFVYGSIITFIFLFADRFKAVLKKDETQIYAYTSVRLGHIKHNVYINSVSFYWTLPWYNRAEYTGGIFVFQYVFCCFTNMFTYLLPGMPSACRTATKVQHLCLYFAIFSIVPEEWFIDFSSLLYMCVVCLKGVYFHT